MKKNKVLSRNSLPTRFPLWQSISFYLALEHFQAPQWLYGVFGVIFTVAYFAYFRAWFTEERVDWLNPDNPKGE